MTNPTPLTGLTNREAIIDALLRFVEGLDDADPSLLHSAFTPTASVDTRPISSIGIPFSEYSGRDTIVSTLLTAVGALDTTHQLSNFRVNVTGEEDKATLTCHALAQHFRAGQGASTAPEHGAYFLMGNRYQSELVRDGQDWRIEKLVIKCVWSQGDVSVLTG